MTTYRTAHLVEVLAAAPRDEWEAVWRSDPDALVTQSPWWVDALADRGYRDVSRLYRFTDGRRFVLPMVRRALWDSSLPAAWGIGGLIGDAPLTASEVAAVLEDLARSHPLRVTIRPNPLQAAPWQAAAGSEWLRINRRAHVLDLSGGDQVIWNQGFASKMRNKIRKAEKLGVEIELDTSGRLIPEYYSLFELSLERWAKVSGEPARLAKLRGHRRDPQSKLMVWAERLGDRFRLYLARYRGRPAAAIIVLDGPAAHYTRGVMDRSLAAPSYANLLLHWTAIRDACHSGARSYHMGESGNSSSLSRFKESIGGAPLDYAEYRWERLPFTAADRTLRQAVKRVVGFDNTPDAGE